MKHFETVVMSLTIAFAVAWGAVALSALNDGRVRLVVSQLVR